MVLCEDRGDILERACAPAPYAGGEPIPCDGREVLPAVAVKDGFRGGRGLGFGRDR